MQGEGAKKANVVQTETHHFLNKLNLHSKEDEEKNCFSFAYTSMLGAWEISKKN